MIAECAADLLAKVKSVDADLATRTSLTLGGKSQDPMLLQIGLPACWVQIRSEEIDSSSEHTYSPDSGFISEAQNMLMLWPVLLMVNYSDDDDFINVQLPLLEAVAKAVHATDAPSGLKWRYRNMVQARVFNDRLAYELRFTLTRVTQ